MRIVPIRTWIGALNFFILQWFGVRLARRFVIVQKNLQTCHVSIGSDGAAPVAYKCDLCEVPLGWTIVRWVWPLTGWWSEYRWLRRQRAKARGMGCSQRLSDEDGEL